jgi:iron only hydrogenase large subunit-like protein
MKSQIFKNEFMRTAEEIIQARYTFYDEDVAQKDVELNGEQVKELINIARKETIEEAAKVADTDCHCIEGYCNRVDKQSILSLINELK